MPRPEDEYHAWDPDPTVHAKNLAFETRLATVVPEAPPHRKSDDDMNPWVRLALQYGLGAVIALYFIFQFTQKYEAKQDLQLELLRANSSSLATVVERLERADRWQGMTIDLLRAGCINAAKSVEERARCLAAGASR